MSSTIVIRETTLDTNILIYAIDSRVRSKHEISKRVVETCSSSHCSVPLQSLSEFFRATTHKDYLTPQAAGRIVQLCRSMMQVVPPNEADLVEAMRTYQQHGIQFFDALLIATALRARCTTLLTEDMQHNRTYNGITVVNPFKLTDEELDRILT